MYGREYEDMARLEERRAAPDPERGWWRGAPSDSGPPCKRKGFWSITGADVAELVIDGFLLVLDTLF